MVAIMVLLLPALTAACSQIREDVGQPLVVEEARLVRATDYHAVLRLLGPPHKLSAGASGMVFLYEEIDLVEQQLGINLSTGSVALFKAVAATGTAERRLLLVSFDSGGRTQAIHYDERAGTAARGAALQFIFAVAGVVDDDGFVQAPAAHQWGFALLEADLPAALNRQSQPDSGSAGVQQQGTPTAVGQRTLELESH